VARATAGAPVCGRPVRHFFEASIFRRFSLSRQIVSTDKAPQAIGTYSQAVRCGDTLYLSGQIPLDPRTMELVQGDMAAQIRRVFDNLAAVAEAAGGELQQIAKLNIFLTDLGHFALVNEIMAQYFRQPYPARAAIGVASLPKGAAVEMDAVLYFG
jgi:reactive intermediate/imine deaminase